MRVRLHNNTRGLAAQQYFLATKGQKWLKNELAENFKKNIGTLGGCEEACSGFEILEKKIR